MSSTGFNQSISARLKGLRADRGWSLDLASKNTGVSKAMLGQIERCESNPTIGTLWKVATGFNTSLSSFLVDEQCDSGREVSYSESPDMCVRTIFSYADDVKMEVFEITFTNNNIQRTSAHRVGVIEHVIVLEGELCLVFDGEEHRLLQGEAVRFFADQPHEYHAYGDKVVIHNIINYP
ncbi:MAG: helix-turn-helix domain-containing protein [Desulfovibrio sp.]